MKIPLELAPGIVGDDTDFTTGGYRASSGIRFWRNRPETVKGFEVLTLDQLMGVCRTTFGWSDGESILNFAFGSHNGLQVWKTGILTDITPASFVPGNINGSGAGYGGGNYGEDTYGITTPGDYFALTWSFGSRSESFGELFANPRGQTIYRWTNDIMTPAVELTNAPAEVTFMLCTSTGQIMAMGCTDTGDTFNASCVRITDTRDPENWTIGTASNAQQIYLEGNGRIVGGRQIGDYVLIWTDSDLHLGTFTTSWNFVRVERGGLCGPNAAIVVGSTAIWPGPDFQFYSYALGSTPQPLICPIRDDFAENVSFGQSDKIVAAYVSERGEACFFYPDGRDGFENSRVLRLSVIDGAWSPSLLARTSFVGAFPAAYPVGTTPEGDVYYHERGASANAAPLSSFLRTGGQYLDNAERCLLLRGLWPDFTGTGGDSGDSQVGAINLTIFARFYPQEEPVAYGPYVMAPGASKIDFLVSGRIFDVLLESNSSPSSWRMGKPMFDAVVTGER